MMKPLKITSIVVASSNPHKIEEIRQVYQSMVGSGGGASGAGSDGAAEIEWLTITDVGVEVPEPVEDGLTFAANSAIKAEYYAKVTGRYCLADDSGLCVDALDGQPGVQSARFSGAQGPRAEVDLENNRLLLRLLADRPVSERSAAFVCSMALAEPGDKPAIVVRAEGRMEGRILGPGDPGFCEWEPESGYRGRGTNGFGYDPLFLIPELGKTTAELEPSEKNRRSHRGHATRALIRALLEQMG